MFTKLLKTVVTGSLLCSSVVMAGPVFEPVRSDPLWSRLDGFAEYGDSLVGKGTAGNCGAVQLTGITYGNDATNLLGSSYNATKCMKFAGNEDNINADVNRGWFEDGLLNGDASNGSKAKYFFDGLEFIRSSELQNLQDPLKYEDPGWIDLAWGQNAKTDDYGFIGGVIDIDDYIDFTMTCLAGTPQNCTAGTWLLTTDPSVIGVLGSNVFDHLAIILKAANENAGDGGWVVYDFNFNAIFANEGSADLSLSKNYNLSGSWDMTDLGGHALSHFSVAARDPADPPRDIPAPAPFTLFVLGLTLLAGRLSYRR